MAAVWCAAQAVNNLNNSSVANSPSNISSSSSSSSSSGLILSHSNNLNSGQNSPVHSQFGQQNSLHNDQIHSNTMQQVANATNNRSQLENYSSLSNFIAYPFSGHNPVNGSSLSPLSSLACQYNPVVVSSVVNAVASANNSSNNGDHRSSSIAALRLKAREHSVALGI